MLNFRGLRALISIIGFLTYAITALPTIEVVGSKFFDSNGQQFFLKGVAYQLTPHDPLINTAQCQRDASLLKDLGANSIRVYHVDAEGDHSGCMSAFEDAGVYLFVDLDTFNTAIDANHVTWNSTQVSAFSKVMDEFVTFSNTAGFFVGNEVIALNNQSNAAPYIKAATRDLKAYRDGKNYRKIPIGYSAADIAELRPALQDYLTCGGNASHSIAFFGLNAYEWCGPVDFQTSGYATLNTFADGFPVPIFFSETGCNTQRPRDFADQSAIFGPDMVDRWSGSIVYEWLEESNDYGLISYGPPVDPSAAATNTNLLDGFSRTGTPTPVTPDFSNLKAQWATLNPSGVASKDYTPTITTGACPASTSGGWLVDGDVALPTVGQILTTQAGGETGTATSGSSGVSASASSSDDGGKKSGAKSVMITEAWLVMLIGVMGLLSLA